jgi:hypothetical protein
MGQRVQVVMCMNEEPWIWIGICKKCTGYGDAHFLTCPTLRLPARNDDGQRQK